MERDQTKLLQEAEQLRRRWFRQLQAIEGAPNWQAGWKRMEQLRSLIKQAEQLPVEDWTAQPVVQKLRAVLKEADDL